MDRRRVLGFGAVLAAMGGKARARPKDWPPAPKWRPSFAQPLAAVIDRMRYYTDQARDFAVFRNGTCALLEAGLSDAEAKTAANAILGEVFHAHPDMNPLRMDDGNVMVQFSQPALNIVVLTTVARAHWAEIEARHKDGLVRGEVMLSSQGQNVFDDRGKMGLFGRALMFMDAQAPEIVRIERRSA